MDNFYKGEAVTDEVIARIRHNELNALRALRGDTVLAKGALAVEAIKQEKLGISHDDAYRLARLRSPELFR